MREELQRIYEKLKGERLAVNEAPEPFTDEDLNCRGSGFDQLGSHGKAIRCYDAAITLNPDDARYHLNRGNAYLCLSQWDEAMANYQKAIEIDPQLTEAYFNLGNAYAKQEQYKEAIENYNRALALNPELPEIYVSRGNARSRLLLFEDAIKDYHEVIIGRKLRFAEAYLGLGNVHLCRDEYQEAEEHYRKAIEINPEYAEAYVALAKLCHLMGRDKEMDRLLEEAIRLSLQKIWRD